jgi:PAS domain S-box-containing protein
MVATRRAAETALRQSHDELKEQVVERSRAEMQFHQLLKSAPDAMIISKGDGTIMLANEAAERVFAYTSDELVGQAVELLVPARHRERHRELRKRYSDSPFVRMMGTGGELTARRKDGSEFPAEISLGPMRTDEGLFVFSAVRDVTARKMAETALRESQERFDLAVRGTDAGIWDWDLRTDVVYFSPRWKSMLGYAETEIRDSFAEWKNRVHPDDLERSTATVRDYLEGHSPDYELEHRLRHKDGSYRWILARGAAVRDREGKPYRMVGSHIDITDFKRAQEVIIDQQAQFVAAEEIQQLLLPQDNPKLPGFDVGGRCYPAEFAAGDYFDYLYLPDQSFVVVVGDVAGHGIGPALLMAWLHAHLSLLSESYTDLSEIVTRANSALFRETGGERFITLIAGRFDLQARTLSCVSGGHPPGYVLNRAGEVKHRLKGDSLALGILPDVQYPISDPVEIADGDIVVFLTDGILEAASLDEELFGIDACLETIHRHRDEPVAEIIEHLHSAVCRHAAKENLDDDITLVVVKVGPDPQQAGRQNGPG